MTGRDLIIFILENHLEDVECITDNKIPGFMTAQEAAFKWGCGPHTVMALIEMKKIPNVKIGGVFYIREDAENPF